MQALLQRLRELDAHTFEQFCFHLLKEQYPGVEIHHVQGGAGDEGVDLFRGDLDIGCVVWQCKAFPNGVGKSQRSQIRESLRRAVSSVKPTLWVLCLSVDLDIRTHRWWQHLRDSYAGRVELALVSASELVQQLIYRRSLREAFFPQVIMDVAGLRSALANTKHLSTDELCALSADNVAQFLERLSDRDPRFSYEVTFHGNTGPISGSARAGVLVSVHDDQKALNVFARDVDSLRRNPPKARFTLQGAGASQFREFLDTGKPLETLPGDLVAFSSDFDFLLPTDADPVTKWRLSLRQSLDALPKFSFRVTFGRGPNAAIYDLVRFQAVRLGQKEVELRSTTRLPFAMTLLLDLTGSGSGTVHYSEELAGCSADEVYRGATALIAMTTSGEFELYDLEAGKRFLRLHSSGSPPNWVTDLASIAGAAVKVGTFYGVDLRWPASLTNEDLHVLHRLKDLMTGLTVPLQSVHVTITKIVQLPTAAIRETLKSPVFAFDYPARGAVQVFGTSVVPGPLKLTIVEGRLRDQHAFAAFLREAPIGTSIDIKVTSRRGAIATAIPRSARGLV
jgi:hypothetical protein